MSAKICPRCPERGPQPLSNFHNNKTTPDGKSYYCKACNSKISAVNHAKARDLRNEKRRIKYHRQAPDPERMMWTEIKISPEQLEINMRAVEQKAKENGTYYRYAMLATEAG